MVKIWKISIILCNVLTLFLCTLFLMWGGKWTYIQALHQQKILIDEQEISNVNPLFELAKVTNTLRIWY